MWLFTVKYSRLQYPKWELKKGAEANLSCLVFFVRLIKSIFKDIVALLLAFHTLARQWCFWPQHEGVSSDKALTDPLYTNCPAASSSRQTNLAAWEQDIYLRSWWRPKTRLIREWMLDFTFTIWSETWLGHQNTHNTDPNLYTPWTESGCWCTEQRKANK